MEEPETCRICRGEGTDDDPLYYPCKCRGSIRYVHQDCLWEWLRHSNKSAVCELCNTSYKITKVYSPDMPKSLPLHILLSRLIVDYALVLLASFRTLIVVLLWLILLPLATSVIVRVYSVFAEAYPYNKGRLLAPLPTLSSALKSPRTSTFFVLPASFESALPETARYLVIDILEGLVAVTFMLLIFFIVMIVREWVLQNPQFLNELQNIDEDVDNTENVRNPGDGQANFQNIDLLIRQLAENNREEIDGNGGGDGDGQLRGEDIDQLRRNIRALQLQQQQEQQRQQANFNLMNDDLLDPNDDELEGLLDLVAIRGPLSAIIATNVAALIASFVALAFLYFIPYVIGRIAVHVVSSLLMPTVVLLLASVLSALFILTDLSLFPIYNTLSKVLRVSWLWTTKEALTMRRHTAYETVKCLVWPLASNSGASTLAALSSVSASLYSAILGNKTFDGSVEPFTVAHNKSDLTDSSSSVFGEIPASDDMSTRVYATIIGYIIVMWLTTKVMVPWMNHVTRPYRRLVLMVLKQAEAITKVVLIISVELLLFPIFCGILVDIALLPLSNNISLSYIGETALTRPVVWIITHWIMGTIYMFIFALFVSMCRRIMRAGVLYFVRDPNDPEYHPINEMLEKSLRSQMSKVGISAGIYAVIILACFGGVVYMLRHLFNLSILPLDLQLNLLAPLASESKASTADKFISPHNEARLSFGTTFLFVVVSQLYTPRVKIILNKYWRYAFQAATQATRLSSFILNKPEPTEQGTVYYANILSHLLQVPPDYSKPLTDVDQLPVSTWHQWLSLGLRRKSWFVKNGSFVRAPAIDSLNPSKRENLFVEVTKDDEIVHPESLVGSPPHEGDYTIVYRPPNFKLRISIFLLLIWGYAVVLSISMTVLPVYIGRTYAIILPGFPKQISDQSRQAFWMAEKLNSNKLTDTFFFYCLGAFSVLVFVELGYNFYRMFNRIQQGLAPVDNAMSPVKSGFLRLLLVAVPFVIVPAVTGLIVDQYVTVPITKVWALAGHIETPDEGFWIAMMYYQPQRIMSLLIMYVVEGFTILKLPVDFIIMTRPHGEFATNYKLMTENGWWNYDENIMFTRFITLKRIMLSILLLLGPPVLAFVFSLWLSPQETLVMCQWSYPATIMIASVALLIQQIRLMKRGWENTVRDSLYLVGQQLENVEAADN